MMCRLKTIGPHILFRLIWGSIVVEVAIALKDSQISIVPAFSASQSLEGQEGVERAWDEQNQAENELFPYFSSVSIGRHLWEANAEQARTNDKEA